MHFSRLYLKKASRVVILIAILLELSVAAKTLYHVKIDFPSHNDFIAPGFISPRISVTRKLNHLIDTNFKFCATISDSAETSSSCLPLRQTAQLGEFYFSRERRSQIKVYITDEQNTTVSNIDVCEFTVGRAHFLCLHTTYGRNSNKMLSLANSIDLAKKLGLKYVSMDPNYWKWFKVWFDDWADIVEHKNDIKCAKRISGEEAFSCITLKQWIILIQY